MSYYQIIYIFPHEPAIFFVPEENISQDLKDEMWCYDYPPEKLEEVPGIVNPVYNARHQSYEDFYFRHLNFCSAEQKLKR